MLELLLAVGRAEAVIAKARSSLMKIDEHARALGGDQFQRLPKYALALAFHRPEDVAVGAMRVHAHQDIFMSRDLAVNQRQVHLRNDGAGIDDGLEVTKLRPQTA